MSAMSPGHNHDVTNVWLVPLTTLCWWNTPAFIWDPAFIGTWASEPRRLIEVLRYLSFTLLVCNFVRLEEFHHASCCCCCCCCRNVTEISHGYAAQFLYGNIAGFRSNKSGTSSCGQKSVVSCRFPKSIRTTCWQLLWTCPCQCQVRNKSVTSWQIRRLRGSYGETCVMDSGHYAAHFYTVTSLVASKR